MVATGTGIGEMVNIEPGILLWPPYFLKLDANHKFERGTEFRGTGPSTEFTTDRVVAAADGSGYVGIGRIGEDVSTGEEVLGSWTIKVSSEGDSLWARYHSFFGGTNERPDPYDIKNTTDGGYIICGGTDPQNTGNIHDSSWLMKVDSFGCLIPGCHIVGTGEVPGDAPQLTVYPNPATDFLNFQLKGNGLQGNGSFRILDINGQVLKELEAGCPGSTYVIPLSGWPSGSYFIQYIDENGNITITEKVIKT